MRYIYLDYNIFVYLKDKKISFNQLKKSYKIQEDDIFVFSPAHIEEIAVSVKRNNYKEDKAKKDLEFLYSITKNNSLRPITREQCILFNETPFDCYKRVIEYYSNNDLAEEIDKQVIENANKVSNYNPQFSPKYQNNNNPEDILIPYKWIIWKILYEKRIIDILQLKEAINWTFKDMKNKFYIYEAFVNVSANLIEYIGFFREKSQKFRSRLFDVSHIIYSGYCDIFITNDKKLLNKTKAIHSLLQTNTEIKYLKDKINI